MSMSKKKTPGPTLRYFLSSRKFLMLNSYSNEKIIHYLSTTVKKIFHVLANHEMKSKADNKTSFSDSKCWSVQ